MWFFIENNKYMSEREHQLSSRIPPALPGTGLPCIRWNILLCFKLLYTLFYYFAFYDVFVCYYYLIFILLGKVFMDELQSTVLLRPYV